jgi:hypothetical protein
MVTNKKSDADNRRIKQVQKILKLFKDAHGREAADDDELTAWLETPQGKAALAPHRDENDK